MQSFAASTQRLPTPVCSFPPFQIPLAHLDLPFSVFPFATALFLLPGIDSLLPFLLVSSSLLFLFFFLTVPTLALIDDVAFPPPINVFAFVRPRGSVRNRPIRLEIELWAWPQSNAAEAQARPPASRMS
ncbi:uncharacterized protein SPSK_10034 [Sporothrix schenckii 1099-18]|uniref:Uncharacterized protein n=1 Tax=Sporothrix schenckii 1099-18 TaxID=1397361 RepID=A0A0F2M6K4_SPOSC|nr:uncharacterized protein SPSK_10034 [Sporothrix schenckii 1099-18]KJR84729.1 hypothetical protein SPSK_10034 [Sporothrix schenckii 1099-18]